MAPEVKARVFEPFYTTKEKGKGSGLGLAMVYGIVKQSGGHIEVDSEVGVGTAFTIYLPTATTERPSSAAHAAGPARAAGTEAVLLVEDEGDVRRMAASALTSFGYDVLEAGSGVEALRLLEARGGAVDLLATDVVMPGMSGRELAGALRPRYPALKVLYMSGYTDDAVVRHGILQADVAFLQKPYTPTALARKVREVLDQR
jgi:two-component system, cell cycle sensor histidine kinase and response regulator CckA